MNRIWTILAIAAVILIGLIAYRACGDGLQVTPDARKAIDGAKKR